MPLNKNKIVVSGMRPTGRLHIGHFFGVLQNWVSLQKDFQCYFFVADWHSLTTEYADPKVIDQSLTDIVTDWIAAGVDPSSATLFVQSRVPEVAELHILLSMITPLSWLQRVPSYKELRQELTDRDLSTYGFLGYPLLQTADILLYKATAVPVGQDQSAHIELAREIVRRFNHLYKKPVFPEPETLLTAFAKVLGTDGRKMSKSYNNCVYLSEVPADANKKILRSVTDPARIRREDPGNPDVCPVYSNHHLVTSSAKKKEIDRDCRTAAIGCIDCKKILIEGLDRVLGPFREKRSEIAKKPSAVREILEEGMRRAQKVARETLGEVKEAMGIR